MRRWICGLLVLVLCGGVARAQEQPTMDQLKKMYADSLNQLKAAQDRKNELSAANEKLKKENAELVRKAGDLQKQIAGLQEEKSEFLDRTFFLRAYHSAWRRFIELHPKIQARWDYFISHDFPSVPPSQPSLLDPDWPLTAAG